MKNLLQINSVVNSGSTGRIAEEIGQTALNNGWESYIAYGRNERSSKSKLIRIGTDWDIKMHGIQTRLFDRHGLGSKIATEIIVRQIEQIKPDIIHLHNLHGYYLNIELLFNYLSKADLPVVWTLHDCWPMTGHCSHFDFAGCEKWKTLCYDCPQKTSYPSSILFDRSPKNYNLKKQLFTSVRNLTIVPVSSWLGGIVKQSFLSKYPIRVINNGVDLDMFSLQNNTEEVRGKYGIGNRFMLMGVATTWSERKGLEDYMKLSKTLTNDIIIVLVGLSTAQLKTLPPTIIGIARTENISELAKLYSAANIILNLSAEETFGLTTVEGFACGTPSIVYNCTANPELITPETGFIVQKGDIQDLIHAINTIKAKGKSSYGIACRERAEKLYDKVERYRDYLNLYELKL
ncbi:MAG: glycosyltransferase [Mariniphaga sp.]|nr:glycosyltransferase [Mariniphaga sp.]